MDPKLALYLKLAGCTLGVVAITTLAILGKIDGAPALSALQWVLVTFMGGVAALGVAGAFTQASAAAPAATPPADATGTTIALTAPQHDALVSLLAREAPTTPAIGKVLP